MARRCYTGRTTDPLPKGAPRTAAGPSQEDAELEEGGDEAVEAAGPRGGEEVGPQGGEWYPL